jgi:hypothetical protein
MQKASFLVDPRPFFSFNGRSKRESILNSYDEYLGAYKKAVRALYSSGNDVPGSLPCDGQSGD